MAACMSREVFRISSKFRCYSTSFARVSNATAVQDADESRFPPVKPRYPPGQYGNLVEKSAWSVDAYRNELLAIPRVKERLEKMAGSWSENRFMWTLDAMDPRPRNIEFRQRLLKTHIVNGLPSLYSDADDSLTSAYERIKPVLIDYLRLGCGGISLQQAASAPILSHTLEQTTDQMMGRIVNTMLVSLSSANEHLLQSQLDESVRVETFWYVGGFTGEGNECEGRWPDMQFKNGEDAGLLMFQYRHQANWQVRTELPLPEFVAMDDAICREGSVPCPDFSPKSIGMSHDDSRPITMSGHWVGDPCEFTPLSVHVLPSAEYQKLESLGSVYAEEAQLSCGMTAGFGSCAAQAYNQGFSYVHDLTYPITTQCMVTDGRVLRFFCYQLNTLRLWVDDGPQSNNNPLRNIVWASEPMPLYDRETETLNDRTLKRLMQLVMLKPAVRPGVEMRPFLPDEVAPSEAKVFLNDVGDEPLPYVKIGRWQYPRKAVYF